MSDKKKKKNSKKKVAGAAPVKKSNVLEEWFFMSASELDVDKVKEVLKTIPDVELEVWKEMGVIECNIPDKLYMDMEQIACDLQDEESNAFLKEKNVKTLFVVTIQAGEMEFIEPVLQQTATALNGFFCGDTEDFQPQIG